MSAARTATRGEPWRQRLFVPNYQVKEAARYARVSPQTVARWHAEKEEGQLALSKRDSRESLSYMQLIEVAVVAAFRDAKISMKMIKNARDYVSQTLKSEYPFADVRFKTDGKTLLAEYSHFAKSKGKSRGILIDVSRGGQLAWEEIIAQRLSEFEYETALNIALKWHVAGVGKPIIIDPRISFGTPNVSGTPTWILRARWEAGESLGDIADDFGLPAEHVRQALRFENIPGNEIEGRGEWIN